MSASITTSQVEGYEAITLENRHLRIVVIPALGGRIWELEDRVRQRQWIWHRHDVALRREPLGAVYDDVWAGGWEELFPNDAKGVFDGRSLPDHGEWWTLDWDAAVTCAVEAAELTLTASTSVVKTACEKVIRIDGDAPIVTVRYRIKSHEPQPFWFLFKQHLPILINPDCRLVLPGGTVEAVDTQFSTILPGAGPYPWPIAKGNGISVDLRRIPPAAERHKEFVYARDLPESWCGVEDEGSGASLRMDFAGEQLPYVWLFLSYGGWRDVYTAVLEPCTNLPKDLAEAVRLGQAACLKPDEEFTTTVTVTLGGFDLHSSCDPDGEPL